MTCALPEELRLVVAQLLCAPPLFQVHLTRACRPGGPYTLAGIYLWRQADARVHDCTAVTEACELNAVDDARWLLRHGFHAPPSAWSAIVSYRNWDILHEFATVPVPAVCTMIHNGWLAAVVWTFETGRVKRTKSNDSAYLLCALTYAPPCKRKLIADFIYSHTRTVAPRVLWTLKHLTHSPEAKEWLLAYTQNKNVHVYSLSCVSLATSANSSNALLAVRHCIHAACVAGGTGWRKMTRETLCENLSPAAVAHGTSST